MMKPKGKGNMKENPVEHSKKCEQQCGAKATVYAGGRHANDWAGYYCESCVDALKFVVFNKVN
jgi:hypothetical protein